MTSNSPKPDSDMEEILASIRDLISGVGSQEAEENDRKTDLTSSSILSELNIDESRFENASNAPSFQEEILSERSNIGLSHVGSSQECEISLGNEGAVSPLQDMCDDDLSEGEEFEGFDMAAILDEVDAPLSDNTQTSGKEEPASKQSDIYKSYREDDPENPINKLQQALFGSLNQAKEQSSGLENKSSQVDTPSKLEEDEVVSDQDADKVVSQNLEEQNIMEQEFHIQENEDASESSYSEANEEKNIQEKIASSLDETGTVDAAENNSVKIADDSDDADIFDPDLDDDSGESEVSSKEDQITIASSNDDKEESIEGQSVEGEYINDIEEQAEQIEAQRFAAAVGFDPSKRAQLAKEVNNEGVEASAVGLALNETLHHNLTQGNLPVVEILPKQGDSHMNNAERIVSSEAEVEVREAFRKLAAVKLPQENTRTMEDLVVELMRPMLHAWLSENLPHIVENAVKEEITRMAK